MTIIVKIRDRGFRASLNNKKSIVAKSNPSHSYLVGAIGQTIVPTLKAILPEGLFVKLMNDHYGIKG
jgi:hypothetical protein